MMIKDRGGWKRGEEAQEIPVVWSDGRDVGNGGDLSGKKKNRKQESVDSVDVDPENLENRKEAGREEQGAQGSNVTTVQK